MSFSLIPSATLKLRMECCGKLRERLVECCAFMQIYVSNAIFSHLLCWGCRFIMQVFHDSFYVARAIFSHLLRVFQKLIVFLLI